MTGGCARRYLLAERTRCGRGKAPPTWGRQGLLGVSTIRWVLPAWARAKVQGRKARNPWEW